MTVEIKIIGEDAGHALRELSGLSAGLLKASTALSAPYSGAAQPSDPYKVVAETIVRDESGQSSGFATSASTKGTENEMPDTDNEPGRLRGKASGGRARRTKDEIAEDEQLEKLAVAAGVPIEQVDNALNNGIGRETVVAELEAVIEAGRQAKGNMGSDPENRVGPEDEPEVQEQDNADEQAEVEATREPEKPLTVDDVRAAMGLYVGKFEIAATQEDGPSIFADALGKPPGDEPFWKLSLFANAEQDTIKKAVAAWTKAAAGDKRYAAKGGA